MTPLQVVTLLAQVGFPDTPAAIAPDCPVDETNLERATRIVLGESGGNPQAVNRANANGTIDRGLFQINSGAWPQLSPVDALDPEKNARFALRIWRREGGFRPGASAWWGASHFHSLKHGGKSGYDQARLVNARRAVMQWRAGARQAPPASGAETAKLLRSPPSLAEHAAAIGAAVGIVVAGFRAYKRHSKRFQA